MNQKTNQTIGELCRDARNSCVKKGITPSRWKWGMDARNLFRDTTPMNLVAEATYPVKPLPRGAILEYQGLPVFPMDEPGVKCIGVSERAEI